MKGLAAAVEAIASRADEMFDLLGKLVSHPTVSPPARNSDQAQSVIAGELQGRSIAGPYIQVTITSWDDYGVRLLRRRKA